jgi:hypothetical protein
MSDNIKTVGQIIEGHFNKMLDKVGMLPDDTKKLGEIRFADCLLCEFTPHPAFAKATAGEPTQMGPGLRDKKYCKSCGCDMEAKTKVLEAKCPIGRW